MSKTNIKIKVICETLGVNVDCIVKLDKSKFPYIVIHNVKCIIATKHFPVIKQDGKFTWSYQLLEGQAELNKILDNPELTVDKVPLNHILNALVV
jgi:hypothetical protein